MNKNVEINITEELRGSKRVCEVKGRNIVTGEMETKYETLNLLTKGVNPFSKTMWDTSCLLEGYFYVLRCETEQGKIGIMYGISINPYNRLDSHLNYNKNINTKTKLIGLYKNSKDIDKEAVLHLEIKVKKTIGKNFFTKEECSTNTESICVDKLNELMLEIKEYRLIEEDNQMLMEAINKLFEKKGLGDL